MASVPPDRSFNPKLVNLHRQYCLLPWNSNTEILITGDLLNAGISRYCHVWVKLFVPDNVLNFGIGEDHIENVLLGSNSLLSLSSVLHAKIVCSK